MELATHHEATRTASLMVGRALVVSGVWRPFIWETFTLVNWDGIQVEGDALTWVRFGEQNENNVRIMESSGSC